jgi:hypothetical protein
MQGVKRTIALINHTLAQLDATMMASTADLKTANDEEMELEDEDEEDDNDEEM